MERMNWIDSMYEKYLNDINMECEINEKNGRTEVCKRESKYVKKIALSYCDPSDKFDRKTGVAIAYARLIGENVPDYVLNNKITVKDIKIGKMFVLKLNHKIYVKTSEYSVYHLNTCKCTCIENGKEFSISEEYEVEKIF